MGHPLAPSIMQRLATAVAPHLHQLIGIAMVAYLDDWLVFGPRLNVPTILRIINLGLQLNMQKSILRPTTAMV
jgi:hypothetical protein